MPENSPHSAMRRSCLPSLRPSNRRRSVAGAFSRPCCTSTLFLIFPACTQPASAADRLARARHIIEDDEALHPPALDDQVEVVLRSRWGHGRIVVRDPAAKHHATSHRKPRQSRVEDVAADIVKENVDALRTEFLEPRRNVLRLIVDRRVKAGLIGQPAAFLRSARDANSAAAFDLGDLPDDRTRRAGRAGDDDSFACDRAAHLEQAEIGRNPGQAERAHRQLQRRPWRQLVELALRVHHDIILPTDKAGYDVADRKVRMVRRLDAACAQRADNLADLDRRQIGVEGDPAALRRVAGQHEVAHQHFARAGSRRLGLDKLKIAVLDRSLWTAREQPLPVFHVCPPPQSERCS